MMLFWINSTAMLIVVLLWAQLTNSKATSLFNPYFGNFAGIFQDFGHNGITGELFLVNKQTLFLHNFSYDGQGADVYFKIGTGTQQSTNGIIIPDELGRLNKLNRYSGQNLLLTLPRDVSSDEVRWLALWSNPFSISIGEANVPDSVQVPEMKRLGKLVSTRDSVRVDEVIAIDDKTILLRKLHINLHCFSCGFYVGTGASPSGYGIKIPDESGRLRNYFNEDIILRLPRDISLIQLDWFAIYDAQQGQSYGHIVIERHLNVPPSMAFILTYVTSFSNCETILPNLMQVSWEIRHSDIFIQMEARISSNQYAAFGLSGSNLHSKMVGSDVFITYFDANNNKVMLEDFTINGKSQCNRQMKTGVCRDTDVGGSNDLELFMSSYIDGLIKVTFRRALNTPDREHDRPVLSNKHIYVVAAIGTLDTAHNPSYHTVALNTKHYWSIKNRAVAALDFGRPRQRRNCQPPLWKYALTQPINIFNTIAGSQLFEAEAQTHFEVEPWKPATITARNGHVFHVVIGPSGNPLQGYTSITGNESPRIAFWINDLLIPEIHVFRGHNYTFLIETGDNPSNKSRYHPFYITDSREGGEMERTGQANPLAHRVYAGITFRAGVPDPRPGIGRYCELQENAPVESFLIHSIEEYRKTLKLNCDKGSSMGSFQWRPDEHTPDIVYYQSFTQRNMGWKIMVTSQASPVVEPVKTILVLSTLWYTIAFIFKDSN